MKLDKIVIDDEIAARADLNVDGDNAMSCSAGRISVICARYDHIVSHHCPALSKAEWCTILDACNGWGCFFPQPVVGLLLDTGQFMAPLALEVYDACRLHQTHEKWGLSQEQANALIETLSCFSPAETISVRERVERFWRRSARGRGLPLDQELTNCGIVPSDSSAT